MSLSQTKSISGQKKKKKILHELTIPATTRPVFSERLAAENSEAELGEYWENVFCIQVTPFMNKAKASPSPRTTA